MKFRNRVTTVLLSRAILVVLTFGLVGPEAAEVPTKDAPTQISEATRSGMQLAFVDAPLSFEANQGQTDQQVKFTLRGSGYTLFLTSTEAVLVLNRLRNTQVAVSHKLGKRDLPETTSATVLRMKLIDANPAPQTTGLDELPGKVNYFIGNNPRNWRTNIPTYAKVRYQDVYPNVDLVFHGDQRLLEYDFVVAPGADPRTITLGFDGADRLEVDARGELLVLSGREHVRLRKPIVYQDVNGVRREVVGRYLLQGKNRVGFQVGSYDVALPLVIDPVLIFSTYLGGGGGDNGFGIAVDTAGNAYVSGLTQSTNFPTTNSLGPVGDGIFGDGFVTKLDASGSALIYSTVFGGGSNDLGRAIAVDAAGNAYVTGSTQSSGDFPTVNALQPLIGGQSDAFVLKLDPTGSVLVYSTFLGGSSDDSGWGIAIDSSDGVSVTGFAGSADFPTANPLHPSRNGSSDQGDAFVAKVNPAGSALVYSTYLGGSGRDQGLGIAVDASGSAYVTGQTLSLNFPTANALQPASGGGGEAFVAKLNDNGTALLYSTYLGGLGGELGLGIAVDAAGDAYVTGCSDSPNFPTANALQPALGGGTDAFVARVNPPGSALVYSTYLGGVDTGDGECGLGIAVDTGGNTSVTGRTSSLNFPTVNAMQAGYGGGISDAFVAKLSHAGSALIYSTYLGGMDTDSGIGIALDMAGNDYVTGLTFSADFPTANALQLLSGGDNDAFVAKIHVPPLFSGGGQRPDVNAFLSYASPLQQRTELPAGTTSFNVVVFYGPTIGPSTFQASLNGTPFLGFTPVPGSGETVPVQLSPGRNVLVLQVDGVRSDGRTGTDRDRLTFIVP